MKQKNLKIVAVIALNCVFALSAEAKNISVVYEKFSLPAKVVKYFSYEGGKTSDDMREQFSNEDKMVSDGFYKMVLLGREYAFSADTTVQNGKLNVKGVDGVYIDLKKNIVLRTSTSKTEEGENVICELPYKKKMWTIQKEKQTIAGQLCKKAVLKIDNPVTTTNSSNELPSGNTQLASEIIAWFCEDLPYYAGPKGFDGLPGLIMRLETKTEWLGYTERYELKSYSFPDKIAIVQPQGEKVQCK